MFCKRIDRYVGLSFLAFVAGGLALIGVLYTVFDVLKRVEEVRELGFGPAMAALAGYYGHLLPVFLVDVAPGFCLVAAGIVLVNMVKRRELLALKASGTSVHRVTAPIFFWALLISAGTFAVRETVGPDFARQREILENVLEGKVEKELLLTDEQFGRDIVIGEYDFATDTPKSVSIIEFYPNDVPRRAIHSPAATWQPGGLYLHGVAIQEFDPSGSPAPKVQLLPGLEIETSLTRFDVIEAASGHTDRISLYHTLPELWRAMRKHPSIPYFRVVFHSRLASFFSPLLLLLVGIPCLVGFERSINSLFLGAIVSIVVATGYYALTFVLGSMGSSDTISAVLAGWLPVIIVGSLGLWLFESMLT